MIILNINSNLFKKLKNLFIWNLITTQIPHFHQKRNNCILYHLYFHQILFYFLFFQKPLSIFFLQSL